MNEIVINNSVYKFRDDFWYNLYQNSDNKTKFLINHYNSYEIVPKNKPKYTEKLYNIGNQFSKIIGDEMEEDDIILGVDPMVLFY